MAKTRLRAEIVIDLINEYKGNLTIVAKRLGVTRQTVYTFMSKRPKVQAALDEARETMIDNVESQLYNKALGGDVTSMIFFLKTQGKKRGYVERQELTGAEGQAFTVRWDDIDNNSG